MISIQAWRIFNFEAPLVAQEIWSSLCKKTEDHDSWCSFLINPLVSIVSWLLRKINISPVLRVPQLMRARLWKICALKKRNMRTIFFIFSGSLKDPKLTCLISSSLHFPFFLWCFHLCIIYNFHGYKIYKEERILKKLIISLLCVIFLSKAEITLKMIRQFMKRFYCEAFPRREWFKSTAQKIFLGSFVGRIMLRQSSSKHYFFWTLTSSELFVKLLRASQWTSIIHRWRRSFSASCPDNVIRRRFALFFGTIIFFVSRVRCVLLLSNLACFLNNSLRLRIIVSAIEETPFICEKIIGVAWFVQHVLFFDDEGHVS